MRELIERLRREADCSSLGIVCEALVLLLEREQYLRDAESVAAAMYRPLEQVQDCDPSDCISHGGLR